MWNARQFAPRPLTFAPASRPAAPVRSTARFAIVTPSLNYGRFIRASIESVLQQDYLAVDYLVKDAGSTDDTLVTLHSYGSRLRWLSEPDHGQANAINTGFRNVEGDLMAWLNSDDLLTPGALVRIAEFFELHPEIDIVYGHRIFIDGDGREIGRSVLPLHDARALRHGDYVPQETLFWRRKVWDALGGLDESFHYAMDWDFLLRASAAGFRFARIPSFIGCFRIHEAQKTFALPAVGLTEQTRLRDRWVRPNLRWSAIWLGLFPYILRQRGYHYAWRLGLLRHR
jgi:glycosyltransferase involved in cell wall biosynthesis